MMKKYSFQAFYDNGEFIYLVVTARCLEQARADVNVLIEHDRLTENGKGLTVKLFEVNTVIN